jgi:adenosine deaminase
MCTPELDAFITRMPKVELHLHLEGSVSPRTLLELSQQNGVDLPARDIAGVERLFQFDHFHDFLMVYMVLARAIVSGEDFERLAYELGASLAAQNVLYAEVMLSPMQHVLRGVDMHEVLAGTAAGFARIEREYGVWVRLAFDYGRQYGPEQAWPVLKLAREAQQYGLVAWSIGGDEVGYPPEPFAEVFAAARADGLCLMAHAGEVAGPSSVWGAVEKLGAQRIGHGIRSIEDPRLIDYLREQNVVLDISPSSNLYTGAVPSWEAHPLRRLYDSGVKVTINTDDPSFFQTSLIDEYRHVVEHFAFTADDLCTLVRNSVQATFLPPAERAVLAQRVEQQLSSLRHELGV